MSMPGRSIRLFSVGPTPVYLHSSFLFLILIVTLLGVSRGLGLGGVMVIVLAIFLSLLVHEFGHVFAARTNGHGSSVVLWGFGGMTFSEGQPRRWRQIWLSAAGPLAGFLFWGLLWFVLMPGEGTELKTNVTAMFSPGIVIQEELVGSRTLYHDFWANLCFFNLFWGILNLLPVTPLDGGHIASEVFQMTLPRRQAAIVAGLVGMVVALGAAVWGYERGSPILCIFMAMMGWQHWQRLRNKG